MRPPIQPVAPHIDDPIELLLACHEKVRRFARLAVRLRDHILETGQDEQAREAARSVLRYFDVAAPLHHEDEERDLFPALRHIGGDAVRSAMAALHAEHEELAQRWAIVRPWLQGTADGRSHTPPGAAIEAFANGYIGHAGREEQEVYPAAAALPEDTLNRISEAMVRRRSP